MRILVSPRMVSLSLWTSVSAGQLTELLRETPEYKAPLAKAMATKGMRTGGSRCVLIAVSCSCFVFLCWLPAFSATDSLESTFFPTLVGEFIQQLSSVGPDFGTASIGAYFEQ